MGAEIEGIGSETLRVQGKARLHGAHHEIIPDRIEAGTYAIAAAITDGEVELLGARLDMIGAVAETLAAAGVILLETNQGIKVGRANGAIKGVDMMTEPFPGFPTDLQAQLMALMTRAQGTSQIVETIFENRFMHVQELARLGARISLDGERATIEGVEKLKGAPVMATDLRASVSLVIAALAAEGETIVNRVYHLDRGFERIEEKLGRCGAAIERLSG